MPGLEPGTQFLPLDRQVKPGDDVKPEEDLKPGEDKEAPHAFSAAKSVRHALRYRR